MSSFRLTAGPWDIALAKELSPDCLRARFGTDRVHSAVHCTDLEEDAKMECEYVFNIL